MLTDVEARELAASERVFAALATFEGWMADKDPDDGEPEVYAFEAMKAALEAADAIPDTNRASHTPVDRGGEDPDRILKDALFACLQSGPQPRAYGGVLVGDGQYAWIRFGIEAAAAPSHDEEGDGGGLRRLRAAAVKVLGACNRPHDLDVALDELETVVRATPVGKLVPSTGAPIPSPHPNPTEEAKALLEGLSPVITPEEHIRSLRSDATGIATYAPATSKRLETRADAIEAALATLRSTQDQDGEVRDA